MSKNKIRTKHLLWMAPLIICLILLGAAGSAFAAIAQDGTATSSSSTNATFGWNHTVGAGSNRLLVVGVAYDARNSNTVSSVKLGAVNLTKLRSEGTNRSNARTDIWYLKAPASGTNTITVTIGGSATNQRNMAGAVSYTGVDQTTPFSSHNGAVGTTGAPSVNVSSATGNLVFDIFCTYRPSSTPSVGSGQTQYWKNTLSGSSGVNGGMSYEAGAATVTMSWTGNAGSGTGNRKSISAASIKAAVVDTTAPSSAVTNPANGATLNSASANPYNVTGTATDNTAVSSIQVSTNSGSTWNNATCTGCPGASVTWSYNWSLPADGSVNIKSRATDSSGNIETAGAGNTVTVHRSGPTVSSTVPVNGATGVALNSAVTINWNENVDCTTVTTSAVTISPAVTWTKTSCTGAQAVFTPAGQANATTYTVTATTGVKDTAGNAMASNYPFSYTTVSVVGCADADGDGYGTNGSPLCPNGTAIDCNDNNINIHPGALDNTCNGVDENCNGANDEGYAPTPTSCGVGVCAASGQNICQNGAIVNTCTAGSPTGADTDCNGLDENCNGTADEGYVPTASTCGVGMCVSSGQNICQNGAIVNTCTPLNTIGIDNDCNGKDENCDGIADNNYVPTATFCGVGVCAATGQDTCQNGRLVDTCTAGTPGVEGPAGSPTCGDSLDNDCDAFIDADDLNCVAPGTCLDIDGDGYGANGDISCPNGTAIDCDDADPAVHPNTAEICDGKDTNCDGWKPATDADKDGDGVPQCKNDCNDNNPTVYPQAPELCDGLDNNCDYSVPVNERDTDSDGYRTCGTPADCNDNDRFINPGMQEWCSDNKDNNCNTQIDETPCICPDADNDGYFASYCGGTDCNDTDTTVHPNAPELCIDGKDNDCNGLKDCADPNAVNCPVITDNDHDGFDVGGLCGAVDCDDNDSTVYPGATDICDGKDTNCDGWKAPSDTDADGDGVPLCASDCNDNDPNRFPGNIEHTLRNRCNDFIDNDCDGLTDTADPNCTGSCVTGTSPKNGPHFVTLLNPDNTTHPNAAVLNCGKCHNGANYQDPVRYDCQRCHADPADTSDPKNGTLKAQYPLGSPYGYGSAPNVKSHTTWTVGNQGCVTCHNPHTQEQDAEFKTAYGMYMKDYICYDPKGIQQFVEFTSNTGPGSFADGVPYNANICNTCHTTTNHQQNDGTAPGGQDHNNSQNCMACHGHDEGFAPVGGTPAAPHNTPEFTNNCDYCHVSATDYSSPVPDTKCAQCHTPTGLLKASFPAAPDVLTHQAKACVDCHQLMIAPGNLKLVKTNLSSIGGGTDIAFTARTGAGSFADGPPYTENVCNTCHTLTNHHQKDGSAPGGQDHNNGMDCAGCHPHSQAFTPILPDPVAPHNTAAFLNDCTLCHVSSSDFTTAIPDTKCQQCHSPSGNLKGAYPAAPNVLTHQSKPCVGCHEPMFGTTNIAHVRTDLTAVGGGPNITFTAYQGAGSFADGPPYTENVCNTCHTNTNHHQKDGSAPGGQDHNNGADCGSCHPHAQAFTPILPDPVAPHNTAAFLNDCTLCHVSSSDFTSAIPDTKCQQCHSPSGSLKGTFPAAPDVATHQGKACIGCHEPMFGTTNIAHVRTDLTAVGGGPNITFTAYTGTGSFADGPPYMENVCNTCHTATNHHQNDGSAPGGQDHNNSTDCGACHKHLDQFQPSGSCRDCHSIQQGDRAPVVGQFSGNSHHVQGVTLTDSICYQCHWEANSDGTINNSYHGGWNAPGSPINLVIYGNGTRPSAYALGTTAVAYTAIAGTTNITATVGNDSGSWPYGGTAQSIANRVYVDSTRPANADGVINTFRLYVTQGSGTIWIFTGPKSGTTVTPRSVATVTIQGINSTNTWTNLNLTVKAGDVVGFYGSTLRVRQDAAGTGSAAYSTSAVTPTVGVPITVSTASTARLAVYATGSATVSSGAVARTELVKVNQHCLGCHSAQNNTAQPFGDGKTPRQYAWDGMSIAERYSQTGTTPWGKYSDTSTTNITPKNTQTKAFSSHGNAAANQRGWDLSETWPNTSGAENVLCLDCHNSHGSTVAGKTSNYTSTTANGAILKDVTAGLSGYSMSYKPQDGGSIPENSAYASGAGLCFDCHLTQNSGTTPWGYQNTFGATQGILGYFDSPYFAPGLSGPQQRYTYKASDGVYKAGHLGASAPLSKPVTGTIQGLCTPCHDPHGVSPSLGANQQYAVPLLKGTWITSPYKEDVAPANTNEQRGCNGEKCRNVLFSNSSTPGYHIDQNTFADWNFTSTASVSQSVNEFGGLCVQCHPKTSLSPDTNSSWTSMDRIHNSVKGWDNDGSTMHRFTCSKCHSPHTATLGRLLVSNCLDSAHRGRVATGGPTPPNQSGSGEEGYGDGRFPAGGGGIVFKNDGISPLQGPFFFGTSSGGRACHDNENTTPYPDNQLWNVVTPWGDLGN